MKYIVLIEDEDDIRITLSMSLSSRGYVVDDFDSGESAIEAIKTKDARPDIVIIDSGLPGMSGLEVGRAVRAIFASSHRTTLVLFTGSQATALKRQAEEIGFDLFIAKPISLDGLLDSLDQLKAEQN